MTDPDAAGDLPSMPTFQFTKAVRKVCMRAVSTPHCSACPLLSDNREVGRAGVMPSEVASALTAWMLQISA